MRTAGSRPSRPSGRQRASAASSSTATWSRSFSEKPQIGEGWINGGFFVLEPEVLDYIDGDETILERAAARALGRGRAVDGVPARGGFWQCMDTLRDVRFSKSLWERGEAPWTVRQMSDGSEQMPRRASSSPARPASSARGWSRNSRREGATVVGARAGCRSARAELCRSGDPARVTVVNGAAGGLRDAGAGHQRARGRHGLPSRRADHCRASRTDRRCRPSRRMSAARITCSKPAACTATLVRRVVSPRATRRTAIRHTALHRGYAAQRPPSLRSLQERAPT